MFIAFDLDGTLADPSEGVTNGINHTLKALGRRPRPATELLKYIGPPTEWIFADVLQTSDTQLVEQARAIFTEFYRTTGFSQNTLYPDTLWLVEQLRLQGHYLVVVTAKSDSGAKAAAAHFRLAEYFDGVFGRINDCTKTESLQAALATSPVRPAVMIGDRRYDVAAGKACDCITIGVQYGFGGHTELQEANPDFFVPSQQAILDVIRKIQSEKVS